MVEKFTIMPGPGFEPSEGHDHLKKHLLDCNLIVINLTS